MLHVGEETGNALGRPEDRPTLEVGPELRKYRLKAGISLADLARRANYSKGYLSKIENGRVPATAEVLRICDTALAAGGELAALVERTHLPAEPVLIGGMGGGEEVMWVTGMHADGSGWALPMNRRDALFAGVSSYIGLQLQPHPSRRPPALRPALEGFRTLFEQVRRLGQTTGPGMVLPMVIAQTQTVRGMAARAAGSPERTAFLRLAARYAEFGGWMAQEAGNEGIALFLTGVAAEIAADVGERELQAHAWVRQASITLYRDDAAQTVELARRAQDDQRVSPRVRGLAALREAQGHALGGAYDDCRRALDRGQGLLERATTPDETGSALGPTSVSDMGAVVTGWCLHDLGRPRQAADVLDPQFRRMPEASRRARARFGTRLALARLAAGETDEACALLGRLLDEIETVDSATIRLDLKRFTRSLPQWRSYPYARDLQARLSALLRVPMP